jgi:hypothetical protein
MIENIIWMLILMAAAAFAGLKAVKNQPNNKILYVILAEIALLLRFVITFIIFNNGTETSGTDGLLYHQVAKDVADQLRSGTSVFNLDYKFTWYTVVLGIQYFLFGVNRYAASFINAFFSILTGFSITKIALGLRFSPRKSMVLGIVYIFIPSMMAWTTDTRKESLTFFVSVLIWYLALKLIKERDWPKKRQALFVLLICLLLWISTLLRIYMFITLGGGLLVCHFFLYLKTRRVNTLLIGITVLITVVALFFTTVFYNLQDYHAITVEEDEIGDDDIENEIYTIFEIIKSRDIPTAISGFLTKPHPENVSSITDITGYYFLVTVVKIEMYLWYACMILSLFGILNIILKKDPYMLGMLAFIVSYILIVALLSEDVADTYYRYRACIIAPVLLFADHRPLLEQMKTLMTER